MKLIYFDNAATTYPKPREVTSRVCQFIKKGYANAGRSGHYLSLQCAEMIYNTREAVAKMLHFDKPQNVVFTQNATYALNIAIKTTIPDGAHVLTSTMEHNSVLRPLYSLRDSGKITLSFFSHRGNVRDNIEKAITDKTKVIVCSLMSNVTGEQIEIGMLSELRKKYNLFVIVDASQLFCHKEIDLVRNPVDVLCTAGHKGAFGMQGVGFGVYLSPSEQPTLIEGGSGIESFSAKMPSALPERLEAGTMSAPAIASLLYGLEYIESVGLSTIENKLSYYDSLLTDTLGSIGRIRLLSEAHNGVVSFVFEKQTSSLTATILEKNNILTRSGYHCAPIIHELYGTKNSGAVRVSLSILNKESDIYRLEKIIKSI